MRGAGPVLGGGRIVFVFPGHGSQWPGMARALLDCSPVFAAGIDACEQALAPHLDWSLLDVLREAPGAPTLERIDVVQPVLFAMAVSLAGLWRACGVRPDVVVGHSQGEVAAAHVAGGLSLADAARLAVVRSKAGGGADGRGPDGVRRAGRGRPRRAPAAVGGADRGRRGQRALLDGGLGGALCDGRAAGAVRRRGGPRPRDPRGGERRALPADGDGP